VQRHGGAFGGGLQQRAAPGSGLHLSYGHGGSAGVRQRWPDAQQLLCCWVQGRGCGIQWAVQVWPGCSCAGHVQLPAALHAGVRRWRSDVCQQLRGAVPQAECHCWGGVQVR
jgi:hypothetical protein